MFNAEFEKNLLDYPLAVDINQVSMRGEQLTGRFLPSVAPQSESDNQILDGARVKVLARRNSQERILHFSEGILARE